VKLLGLLLVVVVGRPMGTYLQTLVALLLLLTELLYEAVLRPQRFRRVQYMQAAAVGLLVYSLVSTLLLADYQHQASQKGLAAVGIIVGVFNVLMLVYFVYHVVLASRPAVRKVMQQVKQWVHGKAIHNMHPLVVIASARYNWYAADEAVSRPGQVYLYDCL